MKTLNPGPLDMWLVKWIIGPFLAFYLIWMLVGNEIMKYKCQQIAEELGYIEGTYIPKREECICKMKPNSDGTVDENVERVIYLKEWKRKNKDAQTSTRSSKGSHPEGKPEDAP